MAEDDVTVWSVENCLRSGIEKIQDGGIHESTFVKIRGLGTPIVLSMGVEAFKVRENAVAEAKEIRDRKIRSLETEIKNLKQLDFLEDMPRPKWVDERWAE